MTESKKRWEFKKVLARDFLNKMKGNIGFMELVKTAGESAGISWRELQMFPLKDFTDFMEAFSESQGFPSEKFSFLGKE